MLFTNFSLTLQKLENTSSRLEITAILSELFEKTTKEETQEVVYLSLGTLAPNYESILLNLAEKMVIKSIAVAFNVEEAEVLKLYKANGDVGETAKSFSKNNKCNLTVNEVFENLVSIAKLEGEGSQEAKITKMADLLKSLDDLSVKFVARIPVGKLRLGFSEKTIIDALANSDKNLASKIEESYNIRPDIGYIAKLVKENRLTEVTPKIGVPVVPMLAQRLNSTTEMVDKMGEVAVEPKFDGLRIFIHFKRDGISKGNDFVTIFTRNMNAIDINTFPELLEVGKYIKADEIILDTEAVGVDFERERFLDFQKTISRRRKHEVETTRGEVPLQFQVFDCIYINGRSLINEKYSYRREQIEKVIVNGKLLRIDEITITKDPEVIKSLHQKYLKKGLEGVVVKRADGKYVSGRTGWNWVKMKEEEGKRGKLVDTIDVVILGATSGKGKRAGFGIGQFLAGVRVGDMFKTITKVGTGLTDEQFKILNEKLKEIISKEKPKEYEIDKNLAPDFYVLPKVVVELAADEITVSPKHTSGYALRFPRLVKFRDDKTEKEATTIEEIKKLFKFQKA